MFSNINFTADSSLLYSMYNKVQSVNTSSSPAPAQGMEHPESASSMLLIILKKAIK